MIDVVDCRITFVQFDIQPFLGIESLFQGGVVAGELEQMEPLELDGDFFRDVIRLGMLYG